MNFTGSIPLAQPGRKPRGQALAQLTPQQARGGAGGFFHCGREVHKLTDILRHMLRAVLVQLGVFFKKRRVRAEVDADD